ncbi:TEF transcription factor, PAR bZIP family member a isoform X1 [Astyanax mexicanus]|nr:TEF transcription factor, PAR bZIP family member a isoform X1 [Astyanax mexicanus]
MSVEPVSVSTDEGPDTTAAFPVVLKKILETPPPILFSGEDENEKDKLLGDDPDSGGGVSGLGPSAALTPAIWDKTIPYDGETFHLEYMDLEEFLIENGIPASSEEAQVKELTKESSQQTPEKPVDVISKTEPAPVSLLPVVELDQCQEEVITTTASSTDSVETKTDNDRLTPEPVDPEDIEVEVNFEPDPTDLVLSSVPGGELFDPRKHRFTEEELKPQPMIKKAKKVFVPEEHKDEKYWQRRKKNNIAAKRSRDARRLKENQITVRAAFLERENTALRQEVSELRKDFGRCKTTLSRYEAKYGPLAPAEDQ